MARPHTFGRTAELDDALGPGAFHDALRLAIRRRGLPLDRLRDRLAQQGIHVALSSLSGWQNGRSAPTGDHSVRAVAALEHILALPQQTLTTLLVSAQRFGSDAMLDEHSGPLGELLDSLPGSRDRNVDVLSQDQTLVVDHLRRPHRLRSRSIVRALRDGVDRFVVRAFGVPGQSPADMYVPLPLRNCRLGRVRLHADQPVMLCELLFNQTLPAGATWVFEWGAHGTLPVGCTDFAYAFRHPVDVCMIEVRFDPTALPNSCQAYNRTGLYTERLPGGRLLANSYHAVNLCLSGRRFGVAGISWEWPH